MSSTLRQQQFKLLVDDLISSKVKSVLTQLREPLWRLIRQLRSFSSLLSHRQRSSHTDSKSMERLLVALTRTAQQAENWIRLPEEWIAPLGNPATQFSSLVAHLFDTYPVPKFMARVWLSPYDKPCEIEMYLHLAAGRSIRQFSLPYSMSLPLTKKGAAWFMRAPDDLVPIAAMRWAQIRSLGGDSTLARKLTTSTILAAPTVHEPFWESVIRLLVRNQPITIDESICIVNFIHQQKFLPAKSALKEYKWETGTGDEPLRPDFTLNGRSLRSLRPHMTNWISEVSTKHTLPPLKARSDWSSSGIEPIQLQVNDELWIVEELLSRESLCIEGGIMKHCVASYVQACHRSRSSIWSIKVIRGGKRQRALTIEISPTTRKVIQSKGFGNLPPSLSAKEVLRIWANRENLWL